MVEQARGESQAMSGTLQSLCWGSEVRCGPPRCLPHEPAARVLSWLACRLQRHASSPAIVMQQCRPCPATHPVLDLALHPRGMVLMVGL